MQCPSTENMRNLGNNPSNADCYCGGSIQIKFYEQSDVVYNPQATIIWIANVRVTKSRSDLLA